MSGERRKYLYFYIFWSVNAMVLAVLHWLVLKAMECHLFTLEGVVGGDGVKESPYTGNKNFSAWSSPQNT